jgi:hypothetical protein
VVPVSVATAAGVLLVLAADLTAWAVFPDLRMSGYGLAASLGVVAGVVAGGSLLAVGAGFLLRSTAGALAFVFLSLLVLPFVLPLFDVEWLASAASYLPGAAATFLLIGAEPVGDTLTTASATAVLAGWAGAALLAGGCPSSPGTAADGAGRAWAGRAGARSARPGGPVTLAAPAYVAARGRPRLPHLRRPPASSWSPCTSSACRPGFPRRCRCGGSGFNTSR